MTLRGLGCRLAACSLGLAACLFAASQTRAAPSPRHNQILSKRWFHAPVADDDCTVCHTMHGGGAEKSLKAPVPELCYQCHEDMAAKDVVHEPVGAGRCSDCHEVHTADVRPLLIRRVPALCHECHPTDEAHKTRGTLCTGCHGVHSSETSRFLSGEKSRNCGKCHGDKRQGDRVHEPARAGRCLTCHFTHPDPRFQSERLRTRYVAGPIVRDDPGMFDLCDGCHPPRLHSDKEFRSTGFRTAAENLHARHALGKKGIGCSTCHDVHASLRPALMTEWVRPRDKAPKPLQFITFDAGGSCGPVCHAAAVYLRDGRAELGEGE